MCFDHDSRPPALPVGRALPPMAGGAATERLELTSADGTRFAAAFAESPEPRGPAVVILPDVRGLYRFYVELAERFAQAGHHAIAIDYFGRTAGVGERDADFDFMPHIQQTTPQQIQADAAAATAALRERVGAAAMVSVGFCFGGTQSYLAAASHELDLDGVIAFYGSLDGSRLGIPSPPEHVEEMCGPILGLFGGADANIPADQVQAFGEALDRAGVTHEIVVYPDAPHSFFDRKYEEFARECEDAWKRVLDFLQAPGRSA